MKMLAEPKHDILHGNGMPKRQGNAAERCATGPEAVLDLGEAVLD
jgi:hypothetical protein